MQPYSDERMIYDEYQDRYFLTENAMRDIGLNIRGRFDDDNDATQAVNGLVTTNSMQVYNYLHGHTMQTKKQDYVLHHDEECRKILYRALLANIVPLARYGNRLDALDENERKIAIPQEVKDILDEEVPGLGHTLTYCGGW